MAGENYGSFMESPTGLGIVTGGANLLAQLAGKLFDSSDPERIKRLIAYLQQRMGRDVISGNEQSSISNRLYMSRMPEFNRMGEGINRRLGLDSGLAQGELARGMQSQRFGFDADLAMKNKELTANRDLNYTNILAQLESRLYG